MKRTILDSDYTKQWWARKRKEDPVYEMFMNARKRAKKKNLEFRIEKEDIVIPDTCPITGVKIEINTGKCKQNSPSLDRIDNSKGYIKGNVRVISNRANHCKSNLSLEEIRNLYEYVQIS